MSKYAYRKPNKTDLIQAKDLYDEPPGRTYYCPDSDCSAQLTRVFLKGINTAYFRALPRHPHRESCPFAKNTAGPEERYDEGRFDFRRIILGIMSATERSQPRANHESSNLPAKSDAARAEIRVPHTIHQLYELLKALPPQSTYGGNRVADMLFDDRSAHLYTQFVSGDKLIECRPCRKFYDPEKQEFYLESLPEKNRYRLVLTCPNSNTFARTREFLYNHRDYSLVVAGNWSMTKDRYQRTAQSPLLSKKQICLPPKNHYEP